MCVRSSLRFGGSVCVRSNLRFGGSVCVRSSLRFGGSMCIRSDLRFGGSRCLISLCIAGCQRGQRNLESSLVSGEAGQCNLAAGFVDIAPHQRHSRAVRDVGSGARKRRVAGFENEFNRLAVTHPRCRFFGHHAARDRGGADLFGNEAAAVIFEEQLEAFIS